MKQHYIDEKTGISYSLQGDYYLPDLTLPNEKETKPISIWGRRHLRYLKEYRRITYFNLLISGKLSGYLADIDKQAEEMFFRLVEQMKHVQGITEQLKVENTLEWVGRINNIQACAMEIVNKEIIFA